MKIAALEGGSIGVRANAVSPDAIFGGSQLWSEEVRRERAEVHGVAVEELEAFYAKRSLLGRVGLGAARARAGGGGERREREHGQGHETAAHRAILP